MGFEDRLLADALRLLEESRERNQEPPLDDSQAVRSARSEGAADGDGFERRVIARAKAMPVADDLRGQLDHIWPVVAIGVAATMMVALLLGAGAARGAIEIGPGPPAPANTINIYALLTTLLGVQSLLLLLWLGLAIFRPAALSVGSLGGVVGLVLGVLSRRFGGAAQGSSGEANARAMRVAAAGAVAGALSRPRMIRALAGSISHGFWLTFNVGVIVMLVVLLTTRQYTFIWETTILSAEAYASLTRLLAIGPDALGFPTPDGEQVAASQWPVEVATLDDGVRRAWAGMLLGGLTTYGLLPRLALLLLGAWLWRRAKRAHRLGLEHAYYARLRPRLLPPSRSLGVVDHEESPHEAIGSRIATGESAAQRPAGPPAIVGLEIAHSSSAWPPHIDEVKWTDLGVIESREDRARVIETLRSADSQPDPLVIVCDLTSTPDRGIGRVLEMLRRSVGRSPFLVLSAGQAMRERGYTAKQLSDRIADWRELAARAGIDADSVVELDLDHLTDASAASFAQRLRGDRAAPPVERRLERALALIAAHAARRFDTGSLPSMEDQLSLHREIAVLYRAQAGSWRSLLTLRADSTTDVLGEMKSGAARFVGLLPDRLRSSAKWAAAGALAGALGCLATSALISPIAIATLPSWLALGAATAAALRGELGDGHEAEVVAAAAPDVADSVRAAALFALTLELQGRDEASITRLLDETLGEAPTTALHDLAAVKRWLDELRHRFDLALAGEERS